MRKPLFAVAAMLALLAGCVTINVYFPAAAAQKAADQVISNIMGPASGSSAPAPASSTLPPSSGARDPSQQQPLAMLVLDALIPAASAAQPSANLDVQTPAIEAIESRMRNRFHSTLKGLFESGAIGLTHNGDVAMHDASKIPLAQRAQATQAIAAENSDRADLYKQIAIANGHPEWAQRMRESFAKQWISRARSGWYYQDASGSWQKK
ncbi:MAG TPA: YdbL family protein [Rhodanobacteraceae bacterium]|nr:YdbL family protein [Rhodanobacteraceae bacterium]